MERNLRLKSSFLAATNSSFNSAADFAFKSSTYLLIFTVITAKPAETRMGSGKGTLEYWVAVVKPGRVMFEIAGVSEEVAREALRLAMHKLPCKCKIVSRADLEGGDNSEN